MIIQLQPDQVSAFWDAIKHGMVIANRVPSVKQAEFCNRVLERVMLGKAQCWLGMTEANGEKQVTCVGVTTIEESGLGEKYVLLHSLYAFRLITEEILNEAIPTLEKYCKSIGVDKMIVFTSNARLKEHFESCGFVQDPTLLVKEM